MLSEANCAFCDWSVTCESEEAAWEATREHVTWAHITRQEWGDTPTTDAALLLAQVGLLAPRQAAVLITDDVFNEVEREIDLRAARRRLVVLLLGAAQFLCGAVVGFTLGHYGTWWGIPLWAGMTAAILVFALMRIHRLQR